MILTTFGAYIPDTWFDESGLLSKGTAHSEGGGKSEVKRSNWTKSIPLSLVSVGVIAVSSLSLILSASASNLAGLKGGEAQRYRWSDHDISLGKRNQSFTALFDAFRNGTPLINDASLRMLSESAASKRQETVNIKEWAKKLATDIKDADD